MQTIAVLGLGKMGHAIAFRLLDSGYRVIVWNRSSAKANDLIEKGAVRAETPAAASRDASFVISMVADDVASETAWLATNGALNAMQPGTYAIECSTVSAAQVKKLAARAMEQRIGFIDCPVTGLPEAARLGNLTLLVGADPSDLENTRPVLEKISTVIRHFGAVGAGNGYKLMINLMGAVQLAALAEGVAMADKLGLDKEAVIDAIRTSAAASPQVIRQVRRMVSSNFEEDPAFTTTLRLKDAQYALELAGKVGITTPLGNAAARWFDVAGSTHAGKDEATVVLAMKENAGDQG